MIAPTEQLSGKSKPNLLKIEPACAGYDAECVKLEKMIGELEQDLDVVKRKHLAGLKRQANVVASREAELQSLVESSPELFERPKTCTMHGTKVGFSSSVGSVVFEDGEQVVKLIERHLKERVDELVKTEKTPRKDALRTLSPTDLARIGCRIEGAGENVIVKRVAGDVEKFINKLLEKLVVAMTAGE